MNLRITGQVQTSSAIANIRARGADLAKFQEQINSGLRVKSASDDPVAYPALLSAKGASARLSSFSAAATDASATLNDSDTALGDVNDVLVRARQIALEGADTATSSGPGALEALASEVDGLIDRALRSANVKPDGKPLYAGTATDVTPFRVSATDAFGRPTAIAYDGAAESARALTGPGQTVDTRAAGDQLFQRPGADVFQSLLNLRDTLRDTSINDTTRSQQLNARLGDVDAARKALGEARGAQAANLVGLEATQALISDQKLSADTRTGELEGTDFAEAVVRMKEMDTALQAIYATTVKIVQPGILDFIR